MRIFSRVIPCVLVIALSLSSCNLPTPTPEPEPSLGEPPVMLILFVATDGDDSNDCLSEETACLTVSAAIRKSSPWSIINIGPGEFRNTTGVALQVPHSLEIRGAGRGRTVLISERPVDNLMVTRAAQVTISDLTIGSTPRPDTMGSGLDIRHNDAVVVLENCQVRESYRGIYLISGQLTVRNCLIAQNGYGILNSGSLTLVDSTLRENALAFGSGFSNNGTALVENTNFENNGASSGGASTTAIRNSGQLEVNGGRIANNTGDGLLIVGGRAILTGVTVENNGRAGVWQEQGATEIWSSIIRNNGGYGVIIGGRSGIPDFGTLRIRNSALVANRSSGLRMDGGEVHVQNTTFSGNQGTSSGGGGIWQYGGSLFLLDSTVAFNQGYGLQGNVSGVGGLTTITARRSVIALNSGDECFLDPRVTASMGTPTFYTCNEDWTPASLGLGTLTEDAGTLVHPILPDSPLINAGGPVAACPANDQRGFPRPSGSTCDVGAYEFGAGVMAIVAETPEATPELVAIWTETPTPEPVIPLFTFDQNANCRRGPGTSYNVTTSYARGVELEADGRNEDNTWLRLLVPNTRANCWVALSTGTLLVSLEILPIVAYPALLNPPSQLNINNRMCSPNGYQLRLTWASQADGKAGFKVYRNGALLATLGATITSYEDTPPFGGPYTYAVESYSADSTSARAQVTDLACEP
jgi:hypothetical protein